MSLPNPATEMWEALQSWYQQKEVEREPMTEGEKLASVKAEIEKLQFINSRLTYILNSLSD